MRERPAAAGVDMTRRPMPITEVADGVLMLSRAEVNCYLVETDEGPVLIDAGLPATWRLLVDALASIRLGPADLHRVYLTHGHFDHVGTAARLWDEHGTGIHAHPDDVTLVRHPYRYAHEAPRIVYPFRHPRSVPILARMTFAGALAVSGAPSHGDIRPGAALPGGFVAVATPGHTRGHVAFHLAERGVLFTGDALVTLDPHTGRSGPRVVARAATADGAGALRAAASLAAIDARVLLPGHGAPYVGAPRDAAAEALARGID